MKPRLTREGHKENAAGKAPIYLRLTYKSADPDASKVAYIAMNVSLLASEWDQKTQSVIGREEYHDDARSTLRTWVGDAERLSLQHRKTPGMTAAKYKALLTGQEEEQGHTLLSVAAAFYANKARPQMRKAPATLRLCRHRQGALAKYLTFLGRPGLLVGAVDLVWVRRFERWCVSKQGYAVSSTRKLVGYLKEVLDFAAGEQWILLNPVVRYRLETPTPPRDPDFLPEVEVQQLAATTFAKVGTQRLVHAWLFCCYTGLSYIDYSRFEATDVVADEQGQRWICMERQKTGVAVTIPVLPETAALLSLYGGSIPKFGPTGMLRGMKRVSRTLGLSKAAIPALARHTASHRFRNLYGFTDEEAAAILGHSKEVMNSNYSRKRQQGLSLALERLRLKQPAAPGASPLLRELQATLADPNTSPELLAQLQQLLNGNQQKPAA